MHTGRRFHSAASRRSRRTTPIISGSAHKPASSRFCETSVNRRSSILHQVSSACTTDRRSGGLAVRHSTNRRAAKRSTAGSGFVTSRGLSPDRPTAGSAADCHRRRGAHQAVGCRRHGTSTATRSPLTAGTTRLEFEFTAINLTSPMEAPRYRLDGFDQDWIDAGSRRQAFYTNHPRAITGLSRCRRPTPEARWTEAERTAGAVHSAAIYQTMWFGARSCSRRRW